MGIKPFKPFVVKGMDIKDNLTPNMNAFFKKAGVGMALKKDTVHFKAMRAVGISLLNFTLNGSSNESTVPPIMFGVLRGSGSVFVDNVLIGDSKSNYPNGKPNKQYNEISGKDNLTSVTIGFNTSYAARLHETEWTPGGVFPSKQASSNPGILVDVGNKYLEKHINADKETLLGVYISYYKRDMGV